MWIGLGLVVGVLLWRLAPVLSPFATAAVLAYALEPLVARLMRLGLPRTAAVCVIELGALALVLCAVLLLAPILSQLLPLLRDQVPDLLQQAYEKAAPWLKQLGVGLPADPAALKAQLAKAFSANAQDWTLRLLASARIGGSLALTVLGHLVLVPLVLYYLLADWPKLVASVRTLLPPRMLGRADDFFGECDRVLGQYLRGQLLVMMVLAVYYSVGLAMFGFSLAVPVGVFTGLAIFIPYAGYGMGLVLALLAGLTQFAPDGSAGWALLGVAVIYGLGQVVESFFLTPRLVGQRIGLHPIAVIFALLAFGQLFGFVGVLLALPISAVALVGLRRSLAAWQASRVYQG